MSVIFSPTFLNYFSPLNFNKNGNLIAVTLRFCAYCLCNLMHTLVRGKFNEMIHMGFSNQKKFSRVTLHV